MNNKDLSLLEFDKVRAIIAGYCTCDESKSIVQSIEPKTDINWINEQLDECCEARYILEHETGINADGLLNVSDEVSKAARDVVLNTVTLNMILQTLEAIHTMKSRVSKYGEDCPNLSDMAKRLGDFSKLSARIKQAIAPDGSIQPNASPKLMEIRNKQHNKRNELIGKLQDIIGDETQKQYIQEPIITEREGRYVIAVKSASQANVPGIVHDISNTGQTIFIEPWQTVSAGNAIKELDIEEAREIERIITELSGEVGKVAYSIKTSIELAATIDVALAKARFAHSYKATEASCYKPGKNERPAIILKGARHPLIGTSAVPLDLELGKDYSVLVITGPNTGGKTVALKTLGLMCMMTQAGFPVPASEDTVLPVFTGIFADIGDEQSIEDTLSTFGWHMNNISRIMKNIDSSSLVLLDELGAATDPTEGSALARAILNYLVEKQTLAMITTHYAEVKLMAHSSEKIQNASFNFDPNTMMPTYHLSLGTPGGSNAIATAEHFGLPAEIISDARGMLSGDVVKMEALITSLQDEKQKFETLNHDLQIQQTRLEKHNKELEKELDTLKREKKMAIQQIRDDLVREIADVERELKDASSELKKTRSMENVIIARRASQRARTKLNEALRSESDNEEYSEQGEIKIGDIVHLNDYDIDAEVIGINKATGMIDVAKGLVKFNVSELSVKRVLTKTGVTKTPTVKINRPKDRVPLELDLRGKRADEVETLVDNYLNDAAMSNVQRVRIITGYGMGVVKSIVTEMLKTHPLVASFKDAERDEGGGGATNVTLK